MSEAEKYTYEPLRLSRSIEDTKVRLIELLPETKCKMIACNMHCFSLSDCPQYVAISYTWGSPLVIKEMRINNKQFYVRENLWWCLYNMRTSQRWRFLWIDALCINQDDIPERNRQVPRISLIYTAAMTVVVWLGSATDESNLAIDYIVQKGCKPLQAKGDGFRQIWSKQHGRAVLDLCERPYWTRVWIIQEVMMAQYIIFLCGDKSFEWRDINYIFKNLKRIANHIHVEHHRYVAAVLASPGGSIIEQKRQWNALPLEGQTFTLKHLLKQYRNQRSTEIRDKVYALLGLTNLNDPNPTKHQIYVDYSKPVEDIYRDVLQSIWSSDQFATEEEILYISNILQQALRLDSASEIVQYETNRAVNRSNFVPPLDQ